ncbi:hypothetical protein N2384_01755 [Bacillus paralicheniformis]|nr:hypothetical protein [Bacillus paralicheniformis]UWS61966.1 hypothetical protein N2384_01755 [Bacillus paralicheniformis]
MIAGVSIPAFYLAAVYLDVVAVKLRWIAVAGGQGMMNVWSPALCLN